MTTEEFDREMSRLAETFPNAYRDERRKLIWREVYQLPAQVWAKVVDYLIGDSRQPPMMPEIREAVSRERERSWQFKKREHQAQAQEFWASLEEYQTICPMIRDCLDRQDESAWDALYRLIERMRLPKEGG